MPASADVSLFCFGYAGASAAIYHRWKKHLPDWISLCPIELPGHGRRLSEPLEVSIEGMVSRVLPELEPRLGGPVALFGHSLGAIVAFEVAQKLVARTAVEPLMLFASGASAPSRRDRERYARLESDAELQAELGRLAGTPAAILGDESMMALTLPILRADFQACASYWASAERKLGCPIHAFAGVADSTPQEAVAAWRDHTRGEFSMLSLPGGHFFINEQEAALSRHVSLALGVRLGELERSPAQPLSEAPRRARASAAPSHVQVLGRGQP